MSREPFQNGEFTMNGINEVRQMQESLLALLPVWNHRIEKPLKQTLEDGISLEMYYCLQTLRSFNGMLTMSELARWLKTPKQQMTKLINRLVEHELVERVYDPADRRIIKIRITEKALTYINSFLDHDAECFRSILEKMDDQDRREFKAATDTLLRILIK